MPDPDLCLILICRYRSNFNEKICKILSITYQFLWWHFLRECVLSFWKVTKLQLVPTSHLHSGHQFVLIYWSVNYLITTKPPSFCRSFQIKKSELLELHYASNYISSEPWTVNFRRVCFLNLVQRACVWMSEENYNRAALLT